MACESEKREARGFKSDAKTVFVPPKREQGTGVVSKNCALVAGFMLGGFMAVVIAGATAVAQLFT
jgi:hypothetical protein